MPVIFQRMILTVILLPLFCFSSNADRRNRYTVETEKGYAQRIKQICEENNFFVLLEVTTEMFIIQYKGDGSGSEVLERISDQHQNEILFWEPVRIYDNDLEPAEGIRTNSSSFLPGNDSKPHSVCKDYHGMNIEDVWNQNITGKGIVLAIADVGINVDRLELKNIIDNTLSFNFEDPSSDVTPEVFPNMTCECFEKTDHANRMASVMVAEKSNYICSAGIAYNAKVAALKIFEVKCNPGEYIGQQTDGAILAKAFLHKPNDIDIFVNAWRPKENCDRLDRAPVEALKKGTETARVLFKKMKYAYQEWPHPAYTASPHSQKVERKREHGITKISFKMDATNK